MNWTVDGLVIRVTEKTIESAEEVCPHVVVGGSAHYLGEHDSFGPVSNWLCCRACYDAVQEAQEERDAVETEVCFDCKLEKPRDLVSRRNCTTTKTRPSNPTCVCQ